MNFAVSYNDYRRNIAAQIQKQNALKTQIWIAISVYVLVAIVKKRLNLDGSLYRILQILSVSVFEKTPLLQALSDVDYKDLESDGCNQLTLWE